MIFGLLELSKRCYIDPSSFIKHLGLDAGQQQDAQEFSNLFLSVLEQNLNEDVRSINGSSNVIKDQFCGKYAYVTRCSNCSNASERLSNFYELDLNIQGHKTLAESLKGFLQEEKLDGDNQYMCCYCNGKQDATRAIELKSLPPVLNLQLLRFVFDIKTGSKKKLNSCIQFPDVLDMRDFLPGDKTAVYDLNAVLIHRGATAYSGHYVAHIKSNDSQAWFKFNDEEVEKIKGRNLQLGSEEDLEPKNQKQKQARTLKGHHASKNAYMLVYTKRKEIQLELDPETQSAANNGVEKSMSAPSMAMMDNQTNLDSQKSKSEGTIQENNEMKCSQIAQGSETLIKETSKRDPENKNSSAISASLLLPSYVLKYIDKDNDKFENWIVEMNGMREDSITKGQEKQETVKAIYQDLAYLVSDEDKYEWLPLKWFSKWLNDPATAPAIDVTGLMCSHRKVCPDQCLRMKCVSQRGSDQLFSMYGGEVRLKGDNSLCELCVKNKCNLIRTKKRIAEDDKYVTAVMKTNFYEEKCYWIGKGSFRSWRRLAVERLEEEAQQVYRESKLDFGQDEEADEMERNENGNNNVHETNTVESGESGTHTVENGTLELHISKQVTDSQDGPSKEAKDNNEESLQFNEDLLCLDHGGLDPDIACRKLIPESVWVRLKRYFPGCAEFDAESGPCEECTASIEAENESKSVCKQQAADQKAALLDLFHDRKRPTTMLPGSEVFVLSTEFVESWRKFVRDPCKFEKVINCVNSILLCEHGGFLYPPESKSLKSDCQVTYISAVEWQYIQSHFSIDQSISLVFIQENDKLDTVIEPAVCDSCLQLRLNFEECKLFDYDKGVLYVRKLTKFENKPVDSSENADSNVDDPEFTETATNTVRKRSTSGGDSSAEPPEKAIKIKSGEKIVRKSQRHRKARGEKEVNISSKSTLKELKLEIMKLFSVPPFDQNLYIDGRLLEGNTCSLAELRVPSGSVIELIADEPQEDTCFLEDIYSKESGIPESGFKGTNLLSAQ